MSTYLLAFIVSDFRIRENAAKSFNIISRSDAYLQTEYAHNVGPKILAKFEEYLDYKYSLTMEKMDMAAIPDFQAGAMENWGIIGYRNTFLVFKLFCYF